MPNLYMGRGGLDGIFGGGSPMPAPAQRWNFGRPDVNGPTNGGSVGPVPTPGGPFTSGTGTSAPAATPAPPSNVLGAQSIRATGPSQGYDPSYLQNLATSIGSLFARPQGNLSFNPLGNLSEISPPSGLGGNAPGAGAPDTWLQQALNGLAFMFNPPTPATPANLTDNGGGGDNGGSGRRGPLYNLQ